MKKLFILLLTAVTFVSCSKDEIEPNVLNNNTNEELMSLTITTDYGSLRGQIRYFDQNGTQKSIIISEHNKTKSIHIGNTNPNPGPINGIPITPTIFYEAGLVDWSKPITISFQSVMYYYPFGGGYGFTASSANYVLKKGQNVIDVKNAFTYTYQQ